MQVPVVESVLKVNDELAALNRATLRAAGVFALDLIGAPGCGKTALLEATLRAMRERLRFGVIVGDLATARDGERLGKWCEQVVQINTGKGCHLEAHHVRQGMARLDLSKLDVLVIENVGNMICPVGFDLGQDVKVGMFSVTEGDDKPAKHPYLVHEAEVLLLNKVDLLPYVPFDVGRFEEDVRRVKAGAEILQVSAHKGEIEPWLAWIAGEATKRRSDGAPKG